MALRAPEIRTADSFQSDVEALRSRFPEIDAAIEEWLDALRGEWDIPHRAIDPQTHPGAYTANVDYPAGGSEGLGVFCVTYHATPRAGNPMQYPLRIYTVLSITLRESRAAGE